MNSSMYGVYEKDFMSCKYFHQLILIFVLPIQPGFILQNKI
jgi:hypothetical protein